MGAGHFLSGHPQVLRDELLIQQHRPVPPLNKAQLGPDYIERTLRAAGANPYLVVFGTNVVDEERSSRNTGIPVTCWLSTGTRSNLLKTRLFGWFGVNFRLAGYSFP
jgi:hypothetical protein